MQALAENTDLKTILLKQQNVTKLLSTREIDTALAPENYIGAAPIIVDRIIEKLTR